MTKIGLIDVDGHNFPNFALMRIAGWHRTQGHHVEWANPLAGGYDRVYQSKIFTFTPDAPPYDYGCQIIKGGTGYDIRSRLAPEIEASTAMDYSLYPQYEYSVQFFSRGCIRNCPFCLVHDKEGAIQPVQPVELNPRGKHIEILDNNFFANPQWRSAVQWIKNTGQPVNLRGVDIRIMNDEQMHTLNTMRLVRSGHICIAWDMPQTDLTDQLRMLLRHIKPWKLRCYILVGYNSTPEQDLYRLYRLRELNILPHVQPYRDYDNQRQPTQYEKDLAHWVNRPVYFKSCRFEDFSPRRSFKCSQYLK